MVKINMNQQRKLSRHNSRQSSIGETASVCSTKSAKSSGSADTNSTQQSSANTNSKKSSNGLSSKHGSQDSQLAASANGGGAGQGTQAANILNVAEMLLHGVADNEILDTWLKSIQCEDFVSKFIDAGYDMPTLSRITPQDLTAIGVTDPNKRLKILAEIKKLNLQDGIPNFLPASLSHWLSLLRLDSHYYKSLCDQQVDTMEKMCQLTWEDFEELGITKLGHQKRFQLAIERVKELEEADSKTSTSKTLSEPIYDTNPSQILLVASTENHSMNGPIINKQSSKSEISSTGSGSMHSVHSAASVQYQPTYASLPDNNNQQEQQQQSMIVSQQLTPNGIQTHQAYNLPQQQQAIYGQLPPPMNYQQPAAQNVMQQPPPPPPQLHQSHYQQRQSIQQQSLPMQQSQTQYGINNDVGNGMIAGQQQPQQNRQSINQLPFAALAKLPKHQQLLLQQSSIYATLSRQPFKAKQPPPPVPIRTNSLKSNSLVDDATEKQQRQNQHLHHQTGYQQSQLNHCHHTNSTSSLYRSDTISLSHGAGNRGQFNSQTMLTKNKSFSGNAHMEASRQRFLNRISQQPQQIVHQQLPHQLSQQFQNLTNQNSCTSGNNSGSSNQNLIYGLPGSYNGIGTRTLNGNDSNLFRPLPNSYIGVNNINHHNNQQHPYHHQAQQQNALPISAVNSNNDNHRDSASLYHSDDFDLHSDTNSTKSLIMQSSSSLVASPVNQNSLDGTGNQQVLCSLSQGSGSSQTLYNSASSGGSNDQSLNVYNSTQSGDMIQRSAAVAASSCTLNDVNLSVSVTRQQPRQVPNAGTVGSGSMTANTSAANLPSLAHTATSATRPKSTASANSNISNNNTNASHCHATTGKDDDFPPPPSPLSLTDVDEHDLVSLNSADINHGLMAFRVGI